MSTYSISNVNGIYFAGSRYRFTARNLALKLEAPKAIYRPLRSLQIFGRSGLSQAWRLGARLPIGRQIGLCFADDFENCLAIGCR